MFKTLTLGKHFICELSGCDEGILYNNDRVEQILTDTARENGLTIVGEGRFDFSPHGFTCYLLLAESHTSIHVWPEHAYCAVDLFTCNLEIDAEAFFETLQERLQATHVSLDVTDRGMSWHPEPLHLTESHISQPDHPTSATPWGWHLVLNLYDCSPEAIRSRETIARFVVDLCDLIDMRRFGEPMIVNFGDDPRVAGYSLVQLIETSNISGHFANESNAVYLDIFSCKQFDPQQAADFCMRTFQARKASGRLIYRD